MKRAAFILFFCLALLSGLTACSGVQSHDEPTAGLPTAARVLQATGFSRFDDSGRLNVGQRWLSARQIAKLNAYRGLADQLYDEPLGPETTVGSRVIENEVYRVYLDLYLRQAQASDYRTFKDRLKTELQLPLTARFYHCMSGAPALAEQCIREDGKLAYTRLGYKTATTTRVNLACGSAGCSDQFHVGGFNSRPGPVDSALLDAGLYGVEWTLNMTGRTLFNYLLINGIINAL